MFPGWKDFSTRTARGDKPALKLGPVERVVLGWVTTFKQKTLYRSYILSKYIFFRHYHSFSLVLKHVLKQISIQSYTRALQLMWIESVLCQWWSATFFSGRVIFFGLVLSSKLQIELWDSLISEDFIFEVSSQSLKRREAEKMEITINLYAIVFQISISHCRIPRD